MAITNQDSTQIANLAAFPPVINPAMDMGARTRASAFDFTQSGAGDAGSSVNAIKLPGGKLRVMQMHIDHSAIGAGALLAIGHGGYSDGEGNPVAADPNFFATGLDVAAAGAKQVSLGYAKYLDTPGGFTLTLTVTGAGIPDAATLSGWAQVAAD